MLGLPHAHVWMDSYLGDPKLLKNCGTFSVLDYEENINLVSQKIGNIYGRRKGGGQDLL